MRVALVFCAVMAVALAATVPDSFTSQKIAPEGPYTPAANIETATFFTQRDHTSPQQREPVLFVSFFPLNSRYSHFHELIPNLAIPCQLGLLSSRWSLLHLHEGRH